MPKSIATKEDWLDLGLKLFIEKGEPALVVEKMAKSLKISKTSYYWHFKDRNNFLVELAKHWAIKGTKTYIESSKKYKSDKDKLFRLTKDVFIQGHNLNAIRFWRDISNKDKNIELIVRKIEKQRLGYLQTLLTSEFGSNEAENRADMLYHYFLGWSERHRSTNIDENEFDIIWKNIIEPMVKKESS